MFFFIFLNFIKILSTHPPTLQILAKFRDTFLQRMGAEGLQVRVEESESMDCTFYFVRATFDRLCQEAEKTKLSMPLKTLRIPVGFG